MTIALKKATKEQSKLRMVISGPSGAGKTFSALSIAKYLGTNIALGDTETRSASKYADKFDFLVHEFDGNYHPDRACEFLEAAPAAGCDVVIIDSGSHFWNGSGGFLELVDAEVTRAKARTGKIDTFGAWKVVDPVYKKFVAAILNCKAHVIITLRAKQEYSKEDGKVKKLGLAPEMRDGFQYEMDVEGLLDVDHNLTIGKTRVDSLDGRVFKKPGKEMADLLTAWLNSGAPAVARAAAVEAPPANDEAAALAASIVASLEAATTIEEVNGIKAGATAKRDKLGDQAAIVRKAIGDALNRIQAA